MVVPFVACGFVVDIAFEVADNPSVAVDTVEEVVDKGRIFGIDLIILEGDNDAAHGQIPQQKQPDRRRCRKRTAHHSRCPWSFPSACRRGRRSSPRC